MSKDGFVLNLLLIVAFCYTYLVLVKVRQRIDQF